MKALWALGEGTVRDIQALRGAARPLAYTTVMTIMDRLARKGAVSRAKRGRAYVYRALVTDEQVRRQALDRLLTEHFHNSAEALADYLKGKPSHPVPASPDTAHPTDAPRRAGGFKTTGVTYNSLGDAGPPAELDSSLL